MEQFPFLKAYGLYPIVTDGDDPRLWEAALSAHWLPLDDPNFILTGLRFMIGHRWTEEEPPADEKKRDEFFRYGMVDREEWCFEQADAGQFRAVTCPPEIPIAPALNSGLGMLGLPGSHPIGFTSNPAQQIHIYLGITRPSKGVEEAVVLSASVMPMVSNGKALLWKRLPDGSWQSTDRCITRWFS